MPDAAYVRARTALLDTLEALAPHLNALVLVGAQAVYLHTGDADLSVAGHTTDADLAVDPDVVADEPLIGEALLGAGFRHLEGPGQWLSPQGVYVDLLVAEAVGGRRGHRGADLGPHGRSAARQVRGLEPSLIDKTRFVITSMEPDDPRQFEVSVAGPAAMLVAKVIKITESAGTKDRLVDKDAADVLRILRATRTDELARRLQRLLTLEITASVTNEALRDLREFFAAEESEGVQMAVRNLYPEDPEVIAASCVALTVALLAELSG
ncbi:MAG: hypothetical protein ABIJ48_00990 [Actinomycetota bacterium]